MSVPLQWGQVSVTEHSMAMRTRRTAGSEGDGGGPGRRDRILFPAAVAQLVESQLLEKGEAEHRQKGMMLQPDLYPSPRLLMLHASTLYRRRMTGVAVLVLMSIAFGAALAGVTLVRAQPPTAVAALVFDGVTVIDVRNGKHLPAQRVVIVGNRIEAVGAASAVQVPRGARVVDAAGKYLIPGLWDMHVHPRYYTDFFYPLFIANGITGIRDGWSDEPLDTLLQWRREIVAGTRVGPPRQLLSGQALDNCTQPRGPTRGHMCVSGPDDARHVVDSLTAAGASFIKTYALDRATYFTVAAEARKVGIPFGGHLTAATAIEASDSGVGILDHINTSGDLDQRCLEGAASVEQCQPVAEHFRKNGTWWVATLSRRWLGANQDAPPQPGARTQAILRHFHHVASAFWAGEPVPPGNWLRDSVDGATGAGTPPDATGLLALAHRVGLPIMAGTDDGSPVMTQEPPGFALHLELALSVSEGRTPLEALQAATLNPPHFFHGGDSLGTIAPGKLADLVLLDADPLVDITNTTTIRAVVANGRYYDRAALDQLLATVQAAAKHEPQPLGQVRNRA